MNRRSVEGFTLLEVVVAFAILSISVTTLLVVYGNAMRRITLATDYQQALFVAESRMAYLQGVPVDKVKPGIEQGITDEGVSWQSEISKYGARDNITDIPLYKIVVKAGLERRVNREVVSLTTLRIGTS